jgi:SAM-dependent methyltransferase
MPVSLHVIVLLPTVWAIGRSQQLDQVQGLTSEAAAVFTMLHHVPSVALQDRLLAEVCRCLRPGGLLVGSDTLPSLRFRLYHLADTMVVVDPDRLPGRLEAAGFEEPLVDTRAGRIRFRARRPQAQTPR